MKVSGETICQQQNQKRLLPIRSQPWKSNRYKWSGGPIFDGLPDDVDKAQRDFAMHKAKYGEYRFKRNFGAAAKQAMAETIDFIIQDEQCAAPDAGRGTKAEKME